MENETAVIILPGKMLSVKNNKTIGGIKLFDKAKSLWKGTPKLIDRPETREFKKDLTNYLVENYGNIKFEGKVAIGYKFYMPDNRRADCSNMLQGIEDCLQKAGIIDDDTWQKCSIAYAEAELAPSKKEVRAEVFIAKE